ncbi:probable cardiolipin synthase (CMP-forming) [Chelonus insularis]|uniref:probable cardiolipin synthase (CMP-forming) n=1 Tax=Chelonus insularis TaxID=460826 RepID=UPI00158E2F7E|nr:probable cardiolipin synthase (CMP-forming) [Chelonus insularis]
MRNLSMSCMMMLRLKPNRIIKMYNWNKCLFNLSDRLYCKADKRTNGFRMDKLNIKARRKALRLKLAQNIRATRDKMEKIIERENIWTIPNFLCVGRIVSTPYLGYLIIHSQDYHAALWILGFAGFTDLIDGWIARTWVSQASKLGSFLDPMADKLLVGTLFLSLTWVDLIPISLTCLVVMRDVILIGAASYIRYRSMPKPRTWSRYFDPSHATVQLTPTFISKLNTAVQLSLVAGTLAAPVFNYVNHPILQGLCYLTAATTIAGGFSYLFTKNTYKLLSKKS